MNRKKREKTQPWAVILVAAGQSKRLKSKVPKPFLLLDRQRTMLDLCLKSFRRVQGLAYVIIVTRKAYIERAAQAIGRVNLAGIVTEGGEQREDSVWRGLMVVPSWVKHVLVHDAARPLVSTQVIHRVLDA